MLLTGSKTKLGPCQVGSRTESPCLHPAVLEIRGIPFCEPCAREQEAYFAIGELTQRKQSLRGKPLAEALRDLRGEWGCTGGIIAPGSTRSVIEEPAEETESTGLPVGLGVRAFSSAE